MFDEQAVIASILKGNLQAFKLLVNQYEKLVFFVISRLVREEQDREDICQEVFIKVHKNLHTFKQESKLSTWIARIAYLTAINFVRQNKKYQQRDYPDDPDKYHFTTEDPEELLIKKNTAAYVNYLIGKMPEQYRVLLTLYHLNEFSYQEIENITGMPEGTVKNYLFRARKLLKERLQVYLKYNEQ
ncbi:sigma-70 family RNA polymerase sigma factor [Mucilaginibacter sp. RS28]|uniref:Sigma-70 family RNA polymerase sigma factor n=1 Tax=Mucilaginibacter straminoryzae TaxID=2932774 RepID=A0A9X1X603_9SPHI|nr:sigma-70 family RNA polymerase sigma factor [Mucilaginibacter straminoryzae]MCJ8210268.1 sigma-70 family RNA polymerase sigma factor [Mucilaginibacter straminoryzae]